MWPEGIALLRTLAEILTAGIAITAFSLLLYAFTFNLRDRVARSFAIILLCVVGAFSGEALGSASRTPAEAWLWFRLEWVGLVFLPAAYLHFSDALLETTGRPSRGRRRLLVRLYYLGGGLFLGLLLLGYLVDGLVQAAPAPYLRRTPWTHLFALFYWVGVAWAWVNFGRAYRRTRTRTSRRRMLYLRLGAAAPALGAFPYLLYGYRLAGVHPLLFWLLAVVSNLFTAALLVVMAYAVAFFGISWPDRVVRSRLFRWLLRGPVTASTALAVLTLTRRLGERMGNPYPAAAPILMVVTVVLLEHLISLFAPLLERWVLQGRDRSELAPVQALEERFLTRSDLNQFLEAVLAAVCDHLQAGEGFFALVEPDGSVSLPVVIGRLETDDTPQALHALVQNGHAAGLFAWRDYWLVPLESAAEGEPALLGLLGVRRRSPEPLDADQYAMLMALADRARQALEDRRDQQQVLARMAALSAQVGMIQQWRAAARYDGREMLAQPADLPPEADLARWVRDALRHYWGGPALTDSPLTRLEVVRQALDEHQGSTVNAVRAILRQAIERIRPEGERRFTAEWLLYNILEMKFMEGRKVRDVALRLAMSEADLYRKQRLAIEAVAREIMAMEQEARRAAQQESAASPDSTPTTPAP